MTRLSKVGRDHLNLLKAMAAAWRNPPLPLNPLFNADREVRRKKMEATVRADLNLHHANLKHIPDAEYYDRMEERENYLISRYGVDYNRIS
jgi:hypothetical protein